MIGTMALMSGTGWTGIEGNLDGFDISCVDLLGCTASFFVNMGALLTFSSSFYLFNLFLFIMYIMLIVSGVAIITGVGG